MFPETPEVEGFRAALRDDPEVARLVFADWLEDHGDPRAAWLRDPDIWPWMAPDAHDPVPRLLEELGMGDHSHRKRARVALAKIGSEAIIPLRDWTRQDPSKRWYESRFLLATARPPVLPPVSELIERLGSEDWYGCWQAIIDLGFHGPAAAPAVPHLRAIRSFDEFDGADGDPVMESAYGLLGGLGAAAAEAIPDLVAALSYRWDTAEAAANALREIAHAAPDVLLANVAGSDDSRGREWALRILVETHPEGFRVLGRILRGEVKEYGLPGMAAGMLEGRGAEAVELVPDLIEALRQSLGDPRDPNRHQIARTLAAIGEPARTAVPVLRAVLAEIDEALRTPPAGRPRSRIAEQRTRDAVAATLSQLGEQI
jgi:uncharacterized protein (TIGR02996 family)